MLRPTLTCKFCWDRHPAQYVARDDQVAAADLAVLAEPGRNIHCIAEIGKLSFETTTLAHDHGPAMQSGTEAWDGFELFFVLSGKARNLIINRKEAYEASRISGGVICNWPSYDDLVADIGKN